jgi:NAD dependent epimerase/dehydratase
MAKVLVTGAGGFIGSHLVEELIKNGSSVRAFVKYNSRNDWGNLELLDKNIMANVEVMTGDISDPFYIEKAVKGMTTVFHLAALIAIPYSYNAPENFVRVNVNGTLNVLQACLKHNVERLVHTSTSETYGTAIYVPIDEKHPLQAQSPYSATKIAADKLVESFYLSFGLPVSTVRPFNTFGPRQSARAVIPTIISQILSDSPVVRIGSAQPVRDFTYVKDTVSGFIRASAGGESIGKVINIGTGSGISIGDLVSLIMRSIDVQKEIKVEEERIRPTRSEVMNLICDNSLAKKELGWQPQYTLERGLHETISFMKKHLNRYKTELYNI